MRLYFAFGSNMDRAHMQRLCPGAEAVGTARLEHHQYFIAAAGYASVAPKCGHAVQGVLWKVKAPHLAKLDAYESVESGLYRVTAIAVHHGEKLLRAFAYIACDARAGSAKSGYQEGVIAAAREWRLPAEYIRELEAFVCV